MYCLVKYNSITIYTHMCVQYIYIYMYIERELIYLHIYIYNIYIPAPRGGARSARRRPRSGGREGAAA